MSATAAFDLPHAEAVVHELQEANGRLAREREVPYSIVDLIDTVAIYVSDTTQTAVAAVDPYLWIQIQAAALRAVHASHLDDERERRRAVRISLEEIRFLFARLTERQLVAEDQPIKDVVRWLDEKLAVSQKRKAQLLGVGERTYQRWVSPAEAAAPEGQQELRARVVARASAQLRHVLTGPGVADWFETPLAELAGQKPLDVLGDPQATERLLQAAVASRSFSAA